MSLTILSVACALASITANPVGGAGQVLSQLDRALVTRGRRSLVVAPDGWQVVGELLALPPVPSMVGKAETEAAQTAVRARIADAAARERLD